MRIEDQESFIDLDIVQVDSPPAGCGDGHFRVVVQAHGFSGENLVWIEAFEFHAFVDALVELKESREGAVLLESLSPHELKLVVRALKKTGQLAIEGELRRNVYIHSRRKRVENRLVFVLDIESECFADIVADFEGIRRAFPLP